MNYFDVFVYGTLRKGGANDHFLAESFCLKENVFISGFCLYDYQHSYPFMLTAGPKETVKGEVYRVDEPTLEQLHILEDVENNLYRFAYLDRYEFYTYLKYDTVVKGLTRISSGDWLSYIGNLRS